MDDYIVKVYIVYRDIISMNDERYDYDGRYPKRHDSRANLRNRTKSNALDRDAEVCIFCCLSCVINSFISSDICVMSLFFCVKSAKIY